MGRDGFFTVFMDVLLIILFLALGRMIFNLTGVDEVRHLAIMFVLMLFAAFSLIGAYRESRTSWGVLMFIVILAFIQIFWVYFMAKIHFVLFVLLILFTLVTFGVTVIKVVAGKDEDEDFDIPDFPENTEDTGATVEEILPEHSVVLKTTEPGKYLASKTGTTYHAPKCEWAKRIKKANRVWLDSDKEAKKKGYKKHDCLK
ncbi:MAG: hypothetical protein U9R08_00485 [Nanoarchaeota archaeon]|nr:hypothetical protein [Nanoarchaeota archaeon]